MVEGSDKVDAGLEKVAESMESVVEDMENFVDFPFLHFELDLVILLKDWQNDLREIELSVNLSTLELKESLAIELSFDLDIYSNCSLNL